MRLIERIYPYALATLITCIMAKFRVSFETSENFENALENCTTIISLILGFIGAIIPIISSMKKETKIANRVFQKDKDKLFYKYTKETIGCGLFCLADIICLFFINDLMCDVMKALFYYGGVWLLISFFLCSYRSFRILISFTFLSDSEIREISRKTSPDEENEISKDFLE